MRIISAARRLLRYANLAVSRAETFDSLVEAAKLSVRRRIDIEFLAHFLSATPVELINCTARSRSQIRQDVFVLMKSNFKRRGYFVEFGAASGAEGSNTYMLEKDFDWEGIVAEPARCWREELHRNRSCHIDTQCVWRTTGETIEFSEVCGGYESGIALTVDATRVEGRIDRTYTVPTVSLMDLLKRYDAPSEIDYVSIDTEGSELEILKPFDFQQYKIRLLTCEHNCGPHKDELRELLSRNGFRLVPIPWEFEDWFERAR